MVFSLFAWGHVLCTQKKVLKLNKSINAVQRCKLVCARTLASITGINGSAVGPVAQLCTRALCCVLISVIFGLTNYLQMVLRLAELAL